MFGTVKLLLFKDCNFRGFTHCIFSRVQLFPNTAYSMKGLGNFEIAKKTCDHKDSRKYDYITSMLFILKEKIRKTEEKSNTQSTTGKTKTSAI